jgi:hypothetical protein
MPCKLQEQSQEVWVTRPRPGVDRVTSAWLIRKFIDPKAKFTFAPEHKKPMSWKRCRRRAIREERFEEVGGKDEEKVSPICSQVCVD